MLCVFVAACLCVRPHVCATNAESKSISVPAQPGLSVLCRLEEEITLCHFLLLLKEEEVGLCNAEKSAEGGDL